VSGDGDSRSSRSARSSRRAFQPRIGPSEIIRKHGISSGQLYSWRQKLARRLGGEPVGPSANLTHVEMVVAQRQEKGVFVADDPGLTVPDAAVPMIAAALAEGLIEIMLPGGVSVRVDAQVDGRALRRVLGALYER
jgi:hypothetical protein